MAEETNGNVTLYLYDSSGLPIGMQYHGSSYATDVWDVYWFEKNLQGDIVAVYSENGTKIISYTYDAWGNASATETTNTVVANNPFRYRGYYYDADLGLYYLNTRYYDSNTGRFISADGYISTGQGILGYNMYAYCNNNPVMYADYTGESLLALLAIVTTGVLICELVVSVIISDFSNEDESYDSAILGNTRDSDYGVLYYETHVDTILGETYRVGAEAGIYSESYSLDWIKANFDAGKADASLGYFGASAGVYFAEFSLEQTYKIFGKEVTLSLGANAGYGASLSFGKKTTIGASYGLGWVFSLEVI